MARQPDVLASLGLAPDATVQRDQLLALMNGQAPNDRREIRASGGDGTRVAGIDMSFSPPKDVSALWAASGPEHRESIERAHKDAVASAMGHLERDVELVRVREAGNLKWQEANSVVAAKFLHNTSRLTATQEKEGVPDPQLHTHVVVLAAERKDGKFAAVDSRQVFLSARETGAWYRSVLAQNLQGAGLDDRKRAPARTSATSKSRRSRESWLSDGPPAQRTFAKPRGTSGPSMGANRTPRSWLR